MLYGEMLTELERQIQAFKTKRFRKVLRISYGEHKTNEVIRYAVSTLVGPQEPLLTTIKRWKLTWFRDVARPDTLLKTVLQ